MSSMSEDGFEDGKPPMKRQRSLSKRVEVLIHKDEAKTLQPTSNFVNPLLTDMYQVTLEFSKKTSLYVDSQSLIFLQITMAYAYWKEGKHEQSAVFDLFFRTSPFKVLMHLNLVFSH